MSDQQESIWNNVISSLQDICNAGESYALALQDQPDESTVEELQEQKAQVLSHKDDLEKGKRLLTATLDNIDKLIVSQSAAETVAQPKPKKTDAKSKRGRSFYTSVYNPSDPVTIGSEVAYRLRQRNHNPYGGASASGMSEWIQCEVLKVLADGTKFEIRDPEPDENNNPGQIFKASYKEILLVPTPDEARELINYPYGTKVLARYPETTTFYLAEVIGTKRDGRCRLRFDGEEEEGKETEVERRLVLPYPE
ncbi:hypothetical protein BABINDRAFT_162547 [Babjeviella inositovora NRRL Y-12698]|uniref:SGF29 C-terminal domain-containing protein n=1 Tax=Babjeviella inositovora NRRL Y-12698 TaxID=984486 RepID=A0A1E3QPH3_9ASCO|nr:uncharacterized protein BABINDRAFT_162547 [Babjeviella inositovora NRRL Y-12698]ODQ78877.1 hypothetical protein BABINDRAFT_162547 [Babjeviella inositovora NRRL Y-12698]